MTINVSKFCNVCVSILTRVHLMQCFQDIFFVEIIVFGKQNPSNHTFFLLLRHDYCKILCWFTFMYMWLEARSRADRWRSSHSIRGVLYYTAQPLNILITNTSLQITTQLANENEYKQLEQRINCVFVLRINVCVL